MTTNHKPGEAAGADFWQRIAQEIDGSMGIPADLINPGKTYSATDEMLLIHKMFFKRLEKALRLGEGK